MLATKQFVSLSGMGCAGCVDTIEKALFGVRGVREAKVNFVECTAMVTGAPDAAALIQAVKAAGYDAPELRGLENEAMKEAAEMVHYRGLLRKALVAWWLESWGVPCLSSVPQAGCRSRPCRTDRGSGF